MLLNDILRLKSFFVHTWSHIYCNSTPNQNPGNNTGNNSGNNSTNTGNTDKPDDDTIVPDDKYKDFVSGNVTVKLPASVWNKYENLSLNYQKKTMSDALIYRYGENSELYELTLATKDNDDIDVSNETVEQRVKLNSDKEFEAVYVVRNDGSVVKLDSTIENGELVFKSEGLGKYLISYKSEESDDKNTDNIDKTDEKKTNYLPYVIGGTIVVAGAGAVCLVAKKKLLI